MNRFTRMFPIIASLSGAALFMACTEVATAPDSPEFAKAQASYPTTCKAQPYAYSSGWIGPSGGVLKAGKNVFRVPAGALSQSVFITMETTGDEINHVVFKPDGLTFNKQYLPSLTLSYQDCQPAPGVQQSVAYVLNTLKVIEQTPSYDDPLSQTVEGKVSHFSDYVLLSTYAVVY